MNSAIRAVLVTGALCGTFFGGHAAATPIVVPNAQTAAEGNDANLGPFFDTSVRYQQVYSASQFGSTDPLTISQISFRPDGAATGNLFLVFSVQIDLSTTSSTPTTLSTTFANNVGADNATVFNSAVFMTGVPITGPAGGPKDFIVTFPITPFIYDPDAGDLLLDVRASSLGGISTDLDAQSGSPFTAHVDASGIGSTVGAVLSTGLVTQFEVSPFVRVSEPSTLPLSALAMLLAMGVLRRRNPRAAHRQNCG